MKLIGKGTYGAVVSATDRLTNEKVAIKKLSKIEDLVRLNRLLIIIFKGGCQESPERN